MKPHEKSSVGVRKPAPPSRDPADTRAFKVTGAGSTTRPLFAPRGERANSLGEKKRCGKTWSLFSNQSL